MAQTVHDLTISILRSYDEGKRGFFSNDSEQVKRLRQFKGDETLLQLLVALLPKGSQETTLEGCYAAILEAIERKQYTHHTLRAISARLNEIQQTASATYPTMPATYRREDFRRPGVVPAQVPVRESEALTPKLTADQKAQLEAMSKKPACEILGVGPAADWRAIKAAYKSLALTHHPDKTGGNLFLAEKFKLISVAYQKLGQEAEPQQPSQAPGPFFTPSRPAPQSENTHLMGIATKIGVTLLLFSLLPETTILCIPFYFLYKLVGLLKNSEEMPNSYQQQRSR